MPDVGLALRGESVLLEPASNANVDLLVRWTLDPVAQGRFKQVPDATPGQLRSLFLEDADRQYFLIRALPERIPVGRFYWRAWRFYSGRPQVDWELNIFIADPKRRGQGLGSTAQSLAVPHLLEHPSTRSVFAYTEIENGGERRALQSAGLRELGLLPHPDYPLPPPAGRWVLYAATKKRGSVNDRGDPLQEPK
jgi:RimJ/RimL family protein N-acetyltransferase